MSIDCYAVAMVTSLQLGKPLYLESPSLLLPKSTIFSLGWKWEGGGGGGEEGKREEERRAQ